MTEAVLAAHRPPVQLTLTGNRTLRLATLFLLYIAQGLPLGLFDFAIPAWLAQNGASAAAVGGMIALITLPWTFKLVYGFFMDRYAFLEMGRRRPWIIASQSGLVASLLALAAANPAPEEIALFGSFALMLGLFSSVQDVAVDGLAVDVLPRHEIERANGWMFGGQAVGIALGGAISGTLIAYSGLAAACLALAAIAGAILLLVIAVRERPGERLLPWSGGAASQRNLDLHVGAFLPIVRNLFAEMFTRETVKLSLALALGAMAVGIFIALAPSFATEMLGRHKETYRGRGSQASQIAGIAGVLAFGPVTMKIGARRMYIVACCGFLTLAAVLLALHESWSRPELLVAVLFGFFGLVTLRGVAFASLAMRLCQPAIAATQFAVFMAISNLGKSAGSASIGWLHGLGGYTAMFAAMALCSAGAAALACAARVGR